MTGEQLYTEFAAAMWKYDMRLNRHPAWADLGAQTQAMWNYLATRVNALAMEKKGE